MLGFHVRRRFDWDCHGLPVEIELDKKLGIIRKVDVFEMGIDKYNEVCRSIVTRYVEEWEQVITWTGRWIDFRNDYKMMDFKFMESVWWVFVQLYEKGLVYRGFKDVRDPETMVSFPIVGDLNKAAFVAWTTTPWTLVRNKHTGKIYVVAESRLSPLPSEKPKSNVANGPAGDSKKLSSMVKGFSGKRAQEEGD
ncbi:isoleucine--tRNA ligase, cytoplasmic-like [Pistacia vera]|uniref:isoleucine--tRNA ligase, cytoplasmic-like n=1 Tax=Pistacia vera TaxID=55513 RepID=UPI0012638F80|nr:isoleucine--tRNA ligase, cytoplasmic-like [Pistacia vera]